MASLEEPNSNWPHNYDGAIVYLGDSSDAAIFDDEEFDSDAELQSFQWPDHLNFGQMGFSANDTSGDESSIANTDSTGYDSEVRYNDDELADIDATPIVGSWSSWLPQLPRLRRFSNRVRRVPPVATMRAARSDRGLALASDKLFDTKVDRQISRRDNQQDQLFSRFLEGYSGEMLAKVNTGEVKAERCYLDLHFGLKALHIKYNVREQNYRTDKNAPELCVEALHILEKIGERLNVLEERFSGMQLEVQEIEETKIVLEELLNHFGVDRMRL